MIFEKLKLKLLSAYRIKQKQISKNKSKNYNEN